MSSSTWDEGRWLSLGSKPPRLGRDLIFLKIDCRRARRSSRDTVRPLEAAADTTPYSIGGLSEQILFLAGSLTSVRPEGCQARGEVSGRIALLFDQIRQS